VSDGFCALKTTKHPENVQPYHLHSLPFANILMPIKSSTNLNSLSDFTSSSSSAHSPLNRMPCCDLSKPVSASMNVLTSSTLDAVVLYCFPRKLIFTLLLGAAAAAALAIETKATSRRKAKLSSCIMFLRKSVFS
jgi:hypothetical protein